MNGASSQMGQYPYTEVEDRLEQFTTGPGSSNITSMPFSKQWIASSDNANGLGLIGEEHVQAWPQPLSLNESQALDANINAKSVVTATSIPVWSDVEFDEAAFLQETTNLTPYHELVPISIASRAQESQTTRPLAPLMQYTSANGFTMHTGYVPFTPTTASGYMMQGFHTGIYPNDVVPTIEHDSELMQHPLSTNSGQELQHITTNELSEVLPSLDTNLVDNTRYDLDTQTFVRPVQAQDPVVELAPTLMLQNPTSDAALQATFSVPAQILPQETPQTPRHPGHDLHGHHIVERPKQVTGPIRNGKSTKANRSTTISRRVKSEQVGRYTSCWRCRRYKKPCTGKGSVCDACVTSGFRVWSTEIGCKRGDMGQFILLLIPSNVEHEPVSINAAYLKPPSWRQAAHIYPSDTLIPVSATKGDAWDQFLWKIQSTGIHGPGVMELLQVVVRYSRKLKKPDKVIVEAARAMSVAADIFKLLVATKDGNAYVSVLDLTTVFIEARKILTAAAGHFLRNCLTGRIKQWFPTFMASNMNVFAYIFIGDAIAAIPPQYRAQVWPDVRKMLLDLRSVIYPTARDLLNALAKGSQPLNMSCWEMVPEDDKNGTQRSVRNPEGMRLVDYDEPTFDGLRDLQLWRERFTYLLSEDSWMATQPLADLLLISAVSRLFITAKG